MTTHNYFAYGSNLNAQDLQRWCREENVPYRPLKRRCVAYLPDHELAFTFKSKRREGGVLDIRSRIGQAVAGVVFEIDDAQLAIIDRKEGAPTSYRQIKTVVLDDNGQEIPVVTYQVVEQRRQAFVPPSGAYVEVVRAGFQDHDLPDDMLDASAANQSPSLHTDGLFVYGTLMRGECRFEHLASFGLLCSLLARAFGRLVDLGSYPGLLDLGDDSSLVAGDFLRLKDFESAIKSLDRIEGFAGFGQPGSLFRRTLISVDVGEGRNWTAVPRTSH